MLVINVIWFVVWKIFWVLNELTPIQIIVINCFGWNSIFGGWPVIVCVFSHHRWKAFQLNLLGSSVHHRDVVVISNGVTWAKRLNESLGPSEMDSLNLSNLNEKRKTMKLSIHSYERRTSLKSMRTMVDRQLRHEWNGYFRQHVSKLHW